MFELEKLRINLVNEFGFCDVLLAEDFLDSGVDAVVFLHTLHKRFYKIADFLSITPASIGMNKLELIVGCEPMEYGISEAILSPKPNLLYIGKSTTFSHTVRLWLYKFLVFLAISHNADISMIHKSLTDVFSNLPASFRWLETLLSRPPIRIDLKKNGAAIVDFMHGWFVKTFECYNDPLEGQSEQLSFFSIHRYARPFSTSIICLEMADFGPRLLRMGAQAGLLDPESECFWNHWLD